MQDPPFNLWNCARKTHTHPEWTCMLRLGYAQSRRTSKLEASGKKAQGCQLQLRGRVSRRMLRFELPINALEKQTKWGISTSLKAKGKLETLFYNPLSHMLEPEHWVASNVSCVEFVVDYYLLGILFPDNLAALPNSHQSSSVWGCYCSVNACQRRPRYLRDATGRILSISRACQVTEQPS